MAEWRLRMRKAGMFRDANAYMSYRSHFDVTGMLHSVVETKRGWWMLRIWRASKFGPDKYEYERSSKIYRVEAHHFLRYIVPPDPKIAKAVKMRGGKELIEVSIFDEHKTNLESLRSGEYVVLVNVHYSRSNLGQSFLLHSGYNFGRGVFKVPQTIRDRNFANFKSRVEWALKDVNNYDGFNEFEMDEEEMKKKKSYTPSIVVEEWSDTKSAYFSPKLCKKAHRWNHFAEAEKRGEEAVAKPVRKIFVGEDIAVDWFGKREARKYHFLTHAHSDHCKGLDRKWTHKVYCSEDTAKILAFIMGYKEHEAVPSGIICPLSMNTPHQFEGFTVTLLDANHCIGSVMFVFEGPAIPGNGVLCTGDLRADQSFLDKIRPDRELKLLIEKKFRTVYIDNTYFNVDVPFPDRHAAVDALINEVLERPHVDIYIPLHRLGREELIEQLSMSVMEPIYVYDEKRMIANSVGRILDFGFPHRNRIIQVVKRNNWRLTEEQLKRDFVIFDITMLGYLTVSDRTCERYKNHVIHIAYSDHSPRNELIAFLKCLHFKTVIPHAKPIVRDDLELMVNCSRRPWIAFEDTEKMVNIESEVIEQSVSEPVLAPEPEPELVSVPTVKQVVSLESRPNPAPENEPLTDGNEFISPAIGSTLDAILHDQNEVLEQEAGTLSQNHLALNLDMESDKVGLLATPSPGLHRSTLERENDAEQKGDDVRLQLRLDSPEEHLETLHLSPVRWERQVPVFSPQYHQERVQEKEEVSKSSPQIKEPSSVTSPAVGNHRISQEEGSEEDVVEKEVNLISEEDDVLVEEEPMSVEIFDSPELNNVPEVSEEIVESDTDYEFDSDPIERDLDKWSIGPPKTLFEAIQRLQDPPMPTTKRSRRHL